MMFERIVQSAGRHKHLKAYDVGEVTQVRSPTLSGCHRLYPLRLQSRLKYADASWKQKVHVPQSLDSQFVTGKRLGAFWFD